MSNWAWAGYITPLDVSSDLIESMLPSTVGMYKDEVYSLGTYDTAVGYLARVSVLDEAGVRTPTVDDPWDRAEFMAVGSFLRLLQP